MPRVHSDQGRVPAATCSAKCVVFVNEDGLCFPARAVPALRVIHMHGAIKTLEKMELENAEINCFALVQLGSGSSPSRNKEKWPH